jgi:hypothetical protein
MDLQMKETLKTTLINYKNDIDNIKNNFQNYDHTLLYNSVNDKLSVLLSMIDKIEESHYLTLENTLQELKQDINTLATSKQKL